MGADQPNTAPTSQATYSETPYEDQSWEVVGELVENNEFSPMDIPILPREAVMTDPMFADYGGVMPSRGDPVRRHLPEHISQSFRGREKQEEVEDPSLLRIRAEEIEAIKAKSFEEGIKEGLTRAVEANNAKLQQMQTSIQGIINDIAGQVTENLRAMEKNAVQLSLDISEKIIGFAVEINPEYIGTLVKNALSCAGSATVKRVRVSPQDMEFIQIIGLPKQIVEGGEGWEFEKDESIRSGCVVDTSAGEIDFRLDEAWERIRNNVVKVLS